MSIDLKLFLLCILVLTLLLAHLAKCLDSPDIAYANLMLTFQSSNVNKYFTKAGIYSVTTKRNASKLKSISGNLIHLVEENVTTSCANFYQSINIALVELKDYDSIETQIRSLSCFTAAILISNNESNEFKFDTNISK